MLKLNAEQLQALMQKEFPQSDPNHTTIEELRSGFIRVRRRIGERNLRPGQTVSGPTMMAMADSAMYLLVLSMIGPVPLALTTHLDISFLRAPKLSELVAEGRMLKLGKRLATGTIHLYSSGQEDPVAHATVTYSIPPDSGWSAA